MHDYELKRLATTELEAAIRMAMNYRDLNLPQEAESICRDVLDVAPTHEDALRVLGLALTDRLVENVVGIFEEARKVFAQLPDEYDRVYYDGVAWERLAKADLLRNEGHNALAALEHALEAFDKAQRLATDPSPDPILRWNRCVRLLRAHPLLRGAFDAPHSRQPPLGD